MNKVQPVNLNFASSKVNDVTYPRLRDDVISRSLIALFNPSSTSLDALCIKP